MASLQETRVLDIVRQNGILRPRDLAPAGIDRKVLQRLVAQGQLLRIGRGLVRRRVGEREEGH